MRNEASAEKPIVQLSYLSWLLSDPIRCLDLEQLYTPLRRDAHLQD
jgi:hypothetical protein